ncbi:hypothetical protein NPIL_98931 [Nephila pilipes]|uniref:Uncharacterized protein n=1 Tax=Nephila pilipes TaxID=299642 RepID=A0A8X6QKY3_NEPPI|nr:hypothetical protein NPIL_98931 [Nephila pilipes]
MRYGKSSQGTCASVNEAPSEKGSAEFIQKWGMMRDISFFPVFLSISHQDDPRPALRYFKKTVRSKGSSRLKRMNTSALEQRNRPGGKSKKDKENEGSEILKIYVSQNKYKKIFYSSREDLFENISKVYDIPQDELIVYERFPGIPKLLRPEDIVDKMELEVRQITRSNVIRIWFYLNCLWHGFSKMIRFIEDEINFWN